MKKIVLALLFISEVMVAQKVIYVKPSATGTYDGSSWANAFLNMESALFAAKSGDEIWVAKGTYFPSRDTNGLVPTYSRLKTFKMVSGVGIYGGFNGTETQRNQRDWKLNETILSGDVGVKGDSSDNSFHVIYNHTYLNSQSILDGFIIRDGNAMDIPPQVYKYGGWNYGGGIFNKGHSEPVFRNLTIKNCYAMAGAAIANRGVSFGSGSAIAAWGDFRYFNCLFTENYAQALGIVYNLAVQSSYVNCAILENKLKTTYSLNAGLYSFYSFIYVINSTIADNTQGRGITCSGSGPYYVHNSIVIDQILKDEWLRFENSLVLNSGGSANWQSSFGQDNGGNIDVWPDFKGIGDYRLQRSSAARNAGDLSLFPLDSFDIDNDNIINEPYPLDLQNSKRIVDNKLDLGAYEYIPEFIDSTGEKICPGTQTTFNGRVIDTAGVYPRFISSTAAGDSMEYFTLIIDSVNISVDRGGLFGGDFTSLEDSASYQWLDCNTNQVLRGDTFRTYTPVQNGSYAVIVTSSIGCVDTSACLSINNVSLAEGVLYSTISLYPNPAGEELYLDNLSVMHGHDIALRIYDLSGREVYVQYFTDIDGSEKIKLEIAELKDGVYIVKLNNEVLRFIKRS